MNQLGALAVDRGYTTSFSVTQQQHELLAEAQSIQIMLMGQIRFQSCLPPIGATTVGYP